VARARRIQVAWVFFEVFVPFVLTPASDHSAFVFSCPFLAFVRAPQARLPVTTISSLL
jgi:hypothetical protein